MRISSCFFPITKARNLTSVPIYSILLNCYTRFNAVAIQLLSPIWLFVTPWAAAYQASLSIANSWRLFKLMFIESVMPSNHFILCHPLLFLPSIFPCIRIYSSELVLPIRWPKCWSFTSASVLPMNIQGWYPLGLTVLISLLSQGLSWVFSNTTVQKHQFFSIQPSLSSNSYIRIWRL